MKVLFGIDLSVIQNISKVRLCLPYNNVMSMKDYKLYNYEDAIKLADLKANELIFHSDKCRLIIDIDKNVDSIEQLEQELENFNQFLYNDILQSFSRDFSYILVQCSSGAKKYRVIYTGLVDTFYNIGQVIKMYCKMYNNTMFDQSIYTKRRLYRPFNTRKAGENTNRVYQYSRIIYATLLDTNYRLMNLSNIFDNKTYYNVIYNKRIDSLQGLTNNIITISDIEDLVYNVDPNTVFEISKLENSNNYYVKFRKEHICINKEVHYHNNAYINILPTGIYYFCNGNKDDGSKCGGKLLKSFEIVEKDDVYNNIVENLHNKRKIEIFKKDDCKVNNISVFNERYITNFITNELLQTMYSRINFVKSPMSTGKTYLIEEYIRNIKGNIIAISPRNTFTEEFRNRLNFQSYRDTTQFSGKTKRIITQIDCLYKFENQLINTIIIDELESNLTHITSSLDNEYKMRSLMYLRDLINNCQNVLCLDAFLCNNTVNILLDDNNIKNTNVFINEYKLSDRHYYISEYSSSEKDIYNKHGELKDISKLKKYNVNNRTILMNIDNIYKNNKDAKIVIVSNIKQATDILNEYINTLYNKKIVYFNGDNDTINENIKHIDYKKQMLQDINENLKTCDVLLYTGCLTVGVDIQIPFDNLIGIFSSSSSSVDNFIQGLNRV